MHYWRKKTYIAAIPWLPPEGKIEAEVPSEKTCDGFSQFETRNMAEEKRPF